jgi:hypothetical protein
MKNARRVFAAGFLSVLLAGCFNPITAVDPSPPQQRQEDDGPASFTVDILIGDDAAEGRFLAGPSTDQLGGLYNYMQLVVLKAGTTVPGVQEHRQESAADGLKKTLSITNSVKGAVYHFLLLLGHWEHDGTFDYYDDRSPTLLAAGLQSQEVKLTGEKVTITMWPIDVETDFILEEENLALEKADGPTPAELPVAGKWMVRWTLGGRAGKAVDALLAATEVGFGNGLFDPVSTVAKVGNDDGKDGDPVVDGNVVTQSLKNLALGAEGSVSFNLTYKPHTPVESVWIIRNGVNDAVQNMDTDFSKPAAWTPGGKNGNGAVKFTVKQPGEDEDLNVDDKPDDDLDLAYYIPAPVTGVVPKAGFEGVRYTGELTWNPTLPADGIFEGGKSYEATVTLTAKTGHNFGTTAENSFVHRKATTISNPEGSGNTITVTIGFPATAIILPSGTRFSGFKLATDDSIIDRIKAAANEDSLTLELDWISTEFSFFNSITDLDTTGLVLTPTTGPKTLTIDGKDRVIDLSGPPTGRPFITVGSGVTLTLRNITIKGLTAGDGPDTANNNAPLITVNGGTFIMGEGVVISANTAVGGSKSGNGGGGGSAWAGVYVASGAFIMEGGEVSGNTGAGGNGGYYGGRGGTGIGGVYVANGAFTMKGGAVSGNTGRGGTNPNNDGGWIGVGIGGVYMGGGTFTLEGGAISGNIGNGGNGSSTGDGGIGGVYMGGGTFTMKGGAVSGNTGSGGICPGKTSGPGVGIGGVYMGGGTFTLEGGAISGNIGKGGTGTNAKNEGSGGVHVGGGSFTMEGGEVIGNTGSGGTNGAGTGGVYVASGGSLTLESGAVIGSNDAGSNNKGTGSGTGKSTNGVNAVSGSTYNNNGGTVISAALPAQAAPSPWSPARLSAVLPATGGGVPRKKTGPAGIPA